MAIASQPGNENHQVDARFNELNNEEQYESLGPDIIANNAELKAMVDGGLPSSKDYQKVLKHIFNAWVSPDCPATDIQSWADYRDGVRAGLSDIIQQQGAGKTVGLFTSGGTIATIMAEVLGLSSEHVYNFYEPVINCSITQLFYSGDRVSLSFYNDHSYLKVLGMQMGEQLVTYR